MTAINSSSLQASTFNNAGDLYKVSSGSQYMARFRDNQTSENIDLSQTVNLPKGAYTLSAELIRQDATKALVELYVGNTYKQNNNNATWETISIDFTNNSSQDTKIGIKFSNKGAGGNIAGAKNVTLQYKNINGPKLTVLIAYATNLNSKIGTLTSDIADAQAVFDGINNTPAYQATIDDAITTLQEAINTKVLAYSYNAAGDDVTCLVFRPGFEGMTAESANYATVKGKDYSSEGWTMVETGDWGYGAIMAYGSDKTFNGASVPATDNAGNTGNTLGISVGWGCTQRYQSEVITLPAGSYRLSIKAYNANSDAQQFTSKFGFVPTSGDPSLSTKTSFASNTWETDEIDFVLASDTEGRFQIGGTAVSGGSGSNAKIFFDNISLTYFDPLKLAQIQWQETWDALDALDETALPDAAETAITDALAEAEPTTVDGYNTAKATLQALIDSYDGIKAAFDEYKALKAQVADLKNDSKYTFTGDEALSTFNTTLSTIDGDAEDATDAATITALLPSLKTAGNTFVGAIESNDGFDLTYNIENNSFETGALSPWTTNGSNDTGVKPNSNGTYTTTGIDGAYLFNTWNNGAGSKVSQTLSSLPEGYYTVTALVASDAGNTINILAGASTKGIASDANGKGNFVGGTTDKVLVSDGSLEIGTNSTTWYKSDYFRLTYYTVTAGAAEAWAAAKAAAEAARDDDAYINVTGSERTELLAEIAKDEPTTAEAYGTATTALQEKTTVFIAAKDSYDGLAAMRTVGETYTTVAWPRASTAKATALADAIAAAPTNAEDAVTKTNAIVTAYRQFVESNGLAEGVAVAVDYTSTYLAGADPEVNTGWTNGIGTDNRSQEQYTKGDGTQGGRYYDGGWSTSAAVNINMTRELTLPAGEYQLQITARGSANLTSYTMSIGGETVNLPRENGDVAVGTFGHGWSDKFVVFNSDGTTPLTLAIASTSTEYQQWISFNRLRLVKLDATLADATDYSNLNSAIEAAEAKTLGFEDGEYAPYNNVAALAKLAEAKAIDQDANNVKEDIQALTTYLNNASNWTANDGTVDIIYNGNFAEPNGTNPKGWTRSNGAWGQQITGLTAAENNVDAETTTAWYYNTNGAWEYGKDNVYKMPLAASQAYKLTFKYRSHSSNSNNSMKASVLNDSDEGLAEVTFAKNGDATKFVTATAYFTTGAAGNYVLSLTQSGNTHLTDVSLVKIASTALALKENVTYAPENRTFYETVNLTRTIKKDTWNTFVVPFSISNAELKTAFGNDVEVAEYSENSVDANNATVTFTKMGTPAITANVPVLLKTSTAGTSYDFANRTISSGDAKKAGTNFDFVGTYAASTDIADGDYFIASNKLYKSAGATTIAGTRAYIKAKNASARIANFSIEGDETTGISVIGAGQNTQNSVFDLQGRRVAKPAKGLYIKNGKKMIVK